ncbi:hypothetical protein EJ05DRAFT_75829 [Pseudovirgaria hyperparasitica]|uniref:Uncharacterized protein n=1 Tax=Pseudovirgaria hyperparasitica TaxID=470096 RepID=A0A6A6W1F6_9PEZI|nr:uncharacterized protein EJ05DRAFT_75829 [Pseudovirgaria hyperparasitica]KAF2756742.1 hypothetical protein EJ05DRAFT_75829 [Pseudovirgaria hyperparasitica]
MDSSTMNGMGWTDDGSIKWARQPWRFCIYRSLVAYPQPPPTKQPPSPTHPQSLSSSTTQDCVTPPSHTNPLYHTSCRIPNHNAPPLFHSPTSPFSLSLSLASPVGRNHNIHVTRFLVCGIYTCGTCRWGPSV